MTAAKLQPRESPRAAYIHVPFCRHRCGYCNFTLVAGRDDLIGAYREAVGLARRFATSVSLDLIFGVPGESLADWKQDLQAALALAPHHVSTYGLTFEKGTSFWSRLSHGELARVEEEIERQMYEAAI